MKFPDVWTNYCSHVPTVRHLESPGRRSNVPYPIKYSTLTTINVLFFTYFFIQTKKNYIYILYCNVFVFIFYFKLKVLINVRLNMVQLLTSYGMLTHSKAQAYFYNHIRSFLLARELRTLNRNQ